MVRFGTKRVETSPPFSIFKTHKKPILKQIRMGFFNSSFLEETMFYYYLLAAYNSATLSQLITLKKALM